MGTGRQEAKNMSTWGFLSSFSFSLSLSLILRVHLLRLGTVKQGRATGASAGCSDSKKVTGKKGAEAGQLRFTGKSEKRRWRQVQGVSPGQVAATHCSPGCKSLGDP